MVKSAKENDDLQLVISLNRYWPLLELLPTACWKNEISFIQSRTNFLNRSSKSSGFFC